MIIFYHAFQLAGDIIETICNRSHFLGYWHSVDRDKELQVPLEVEALKDSVTKIDWGTFFLSFFWNYLLHVHVKFNFFFEKSTKIRNKSPSYVVVYFVDF